MTSNGWRIAEESSSANGCRLEANYYLGGPTNGVLSVFVLLGHSYAG
jgi:hypothetical protein